MYPGVDEWREPRRSITLTTYHDDGRGGGGQKWNGTIANGMMMMLDRAVERVLAALVGAGNPKKNWRWVDVTVRPWPPRSLGGPDRRSCHRALLQSLMKIERRAKKGLIVRVEG